MTASELLRKTAEYLEQYGWCQGSLGRDNAPRCLMGAIGQAYRDGFLTSSLPLAQSHEALVARLGFAHVSQLVDWNDAEDRTKSEVVTLLLETADELERAP